MSTPLKDKRNIAILAHVDAGKTTVSERLLYFSDAIPTMGEVDEGLATMDYLDEEKRRGITIEAGIASYVWKGIRVTFVDTPGHVDFGAEVDFALRSVEGVILVISGLSGIESQTLQAWEKIRGNGNKPILFINKLDVPGADHARVLEQIQILFQVSPLVFSFPIYLEGQIHGVVDVVHERALFRSDEAPRKLMKAEIPPSSLDEYNVHRRGLLDFASLFNDSVMEAALAGKAVPREALMDGLRKGLASGRGAPVYMGAALRNVGIRQLLNGINQLLPPPHIPFGAEDSLGFVLKTRWFSGLGKIYLAKIFSGDILNRFPDAKFYRVFAENLEEIQEVEAGDVVAIKSENLFSMGNHLAPGKLENTSGKYYQPLLQARIELLDLKDFSLVESAMQQLAESDPSIHVEPESQTGGWRIRTVGELQLDVFCKRLKREHGCNIRVGTPTVRYTERPKRPLSGLSTSITGFGADARIVLDINLNHNYYENHISFPAGITRDDEGILRDCFATFCSQGFCGAGEIQGMDLRITQLQSSSQPIPSPLLAKILNDCLKIHLKMDNFEIFEPIMRLEIIVPEDYCGNVLADLAKRDAVIRKIGADGRNSIIFLEIPLANTFGYSTLLRSLSKGLGVFVLTYEKYGVKKSG